MSDYKLAYRYGRSLLELAEEKGKLDQVAADMKLFSDTCLGSREFDQLLKKPIVKPHQKLKVLESLFGEKVDEITISFFRLITKKGREAYLGEVAYEFQKLWKKHKGIVEAEIISAVALTDEMKTKVEGIIQSVVKGKIDLQVKEDEDVVGGFLLTIGDRQIDETLRTKLNRIKRDLA